MTLPDIPGGDRQFRTLERRFYYLQSTTLEACPGGGSEADWGTPTLPTGGVGLTSSPGHTPYRRSSCSPWRNDNSPPVRIRTPCTSGDSPPVVPVWVVTRRLSERSLQGLGVEGGRAGGADGLGWRSHVEGGLADALLWHGVSSFVCSPQVKVENMAERMHNVPSKTHGNIVREECAWSKVLKVCKSSSPHAASPPPLQMIGWHIGWCALQHWIIRWITCLILSHWMNCGYHIVDNTLDYTLIPSHWIIRWITCWYHYVGWYVR